MTQATQRRVQENMQMPPQSSTAAAASTPVPPTAAATPAAPVRVNPITSVDMADRLYKRLIELGDQAPKEVRAQAAADIKDFYKSNPGALAAKLGKPDPRIETSPLPTGVEKIDKAGQEVRKVSGSGNWSYTEKYPALEELPPEHPDRIRKAEADKGVDLISGAGLSTSERADMAATVDIESQKADTLARIAENWQNIPDDLPRLRWSHNLNEFLVLRPVENGKFRWTSLDGSGVELEDLGDLLDLGEIGAIVGEVAGVTKADKVIDFAKAGPGRAMAGGAAGTFTGGSLGRFGGEGVSILQKWLRHGIAPTIEELQDELLWEIPKIEAFAAVTGELGAGLMRGLARINQGDKFFRTRTQPTQRQIDDANQNIEQAREDMLVLQRADRGEEFSLTLGSASRSIAHVADEADALANASAETRRAYRRAQARSNRVLRNFIKEEFSGNPEYLGNRVGAISSANYALGSEDIVVSQAADSGRIYLHPNSAIKKWESMSPEAKLKQPRIDGLEIEPGVDKWTVKRSYLSTAEEGGLRGIGFGKGLYLEAGREAQRRGKHLVSDSEISPDAVSVWESLAKSGELGPVVRNPDAKWIPDKNMWQTPDGKPVFRVVPPPPATPRIIEAYRGAAQLERTGRQVNGREVYRKTGKTKLNDMMAHPNKYTQEWAQIHKEVSDNAFLRQDMKEVMFLEWADATQLNGSFDRQLHDEFMDANTAHLANIFGVEDFTRMRADPEMVRKVVSQGRNLTNLQAEGLTKLLKVPLNSKLLRDPSSVPLWNQLKKLSTTDREQAMQILTANKMDQRIRELFKEEFKDKILKSTNSGASAKADSFGEILSKNEELIKLMLDGETSAQRRAMAAAGGDGSSHWAKLKIIQRQLERNSVKNEIAGIAKDQNSKITLTRVIFGPLSRAQRFISAAVRAESRSHAAKVGDIIANPEQLQKLWVVREFPLESRQVALVLQDLDLMPIWGIDGDDFDMDNVEDRKRLAETIRAKYHAFTADQ